MKKWNLFRKKAKSRISRRLAEILGSTPRAFQGQDEIKSSQETARQVENDMQSLLGQIICKQGDSSHSRDNFANSCKIDQKCGDPVPEKLAHIVQKYFWGEN